MGEQTKRRPPGNPAWTPGCPSPNPRGRPRSGLALSERIRERLSPDELIDLVTRALADDKIDLAQRVQFAFQLADRAYSKPPAGVDLSVTTATVDHADLDRLSDDELRVLAGVTTKQESNGDTTPCSTVDDATGVHQPSTTTEPST